MTSLEERLKALEDEVAQLKQRLASESRSPVVSWWEQRFGAFAGSAEYEEADRIGREYRISRRRQNAEEAA